MTDCTDHIGHSSNSGIRRSTSILDCCPPCRTISLYTEAQTGRISKLVWIQDRVGVAFEVGLRHLCGWLDIPARYYLLLPRLKVCLICAKAGKAGALRLCYPIRISRRGCDARHESGMARLHLRNNLHMRCICFPWDVEQARTVQRRFRRATSRLLG